ncbi:hypothetical protein V6N11_062520 [Hibiscus sabdariffa]|uniref:Uncharacterized protein n=1 Tax=Hibiscus sabdariffa TaxID=183260 RepID=A0ABR2PSS8_9ROSI
MKIFSWVQSKLTDKKSNTNIIPDNHHHTLQPPCKEELCHWPHGLLAIGTFGNKIKQEPEKQNLQQNVPSTQDHAANLECLDTDEERVSNGWSDGSN